MNTAFIGLDYIVEIVCPEGKISGTTPGQIAERNVIAHANQALQFARDKGWLSVLVKVGFTPGYPEQPKHSAMFGRAHEFGALEIGKPGMEFHPDLRADLADMVVIKPRVSAFYSTNLEAALRGRKIERVVVAGVSTTWAVQALVRDLHDRDYQVVIVEDACAAHEAEEHQQSIAMMSRIAKIIKADELASL